jgi:flagellar hook-associated protein 1 FlgK
MSTFTGLNIARLGMQAQQKALEVTGHNIANANTPGYSRQVARLVPTNPIPFAGGRGMLGTGVRVAEISRIRDEILDFQIRKEMRTQGRWEMSRDILAQVEYVFMEPSPTGFNSVLSTFFESWQELCLNPGASPPRAALVQNAGSLVNTVRHANEQLKAIRNDIDFQTNLKVQEVNTLAEQIRDLNRQIISLNALDALPADLMDRRDMLADRLSQIVEFNAVLTDRGSLNIYLGGRELVGEGNVNRLKVVPGEGDGSDWPPAPVVVWERDGRPARIAGGELAGLREVRDVKLRGYMEDFTALVFGIVNAVNAAHREGSGLSGQTGVDFFTGNLLENLDVNSAVKDDLSLIAAASLPETVPGDGSNALRIAQLRHARISVDVSEADLKLRLKLDPGGGTTFESYYRDGISRLGVDANESKRMVDNQKALLNMMNQRRDSISGVSVDEELSNMVQFQVAYQASARLIATMQEIFDTIIRL